MNRTTDESGFALIELLVAAFLMLLVLGGVLSILESMQNQSASASVRSDSQEQIRVVLDRLARDLRNAVGTSTETLELASSSEIAFQQAGSSAPLPGSSNSKGLSRVRFCLDQATGHVWRQEQTWSEAPPPRPPAGLSCPDSAWGSSDRLATNVTNGDRPVWTYGYRAGAAATPLNLISVTSNLYLDANGALEPPEVHLRSTVLLRNGQNQPPVAAFTAFQVNGHVVLNASPSRDPEGQPVTYAWQVDGAPAGSDLRLDQGGLAQGSTHEFSLQVTDSGGLSDVAVRTITVR
jgi:type II secretory pathway pseudopilin PulG